MKVGTKVLWIDLEMPGEVVDTQGSDIQVAWEAGYDSPFSGGIYWGLAPLIVADGRIEVRLNGHKVPEMLVEPGRDLFGEAFQLAFEL